MFNTLIATLPVQLACQLICTGNYSSDNFKIGVENPMPEQTTVIPDGYTRFPDIGLAYQYFNTSEVTWNSARKTCIAHGGNLAVIDSFKKNDYIHDLKLLKENPPATATFVGIHRLFGNDEWVSVKTGLPVAVIPWAPDSPAKKQGHNCLCSYFDRRGLTNASCDEQKFYVCEIPLN